VRDVVDAGYAHHDRQHPYGHRRVRAGSRSQTGIEVRDEGQDGERDEAAHEVVARRRSGLGLEVVVVDDVKPEDSHRCQEDPILEVPRSPALARGLVSRERGHPVWCCRRHSY
jgi:hypothetical protein